MPRNRREAHRRRYHEWSDPRSTGEKLQRETQRSCQQPLPQYLPPQLLQQDVRGNLRDPRHQEVHEPSACNHRRVRGKERRERRQGQERKEGRFQGTDHEEGRFERADHDHVRWELLGVRGKQATSSGSAGTTRTRSRRPMLQRRLRRASRLIGSRAQGPQTIGMSQSQEQAARSTSSSTTPLIEGDSMANKRKKRHCGS